LTLKKSYPPFAHENFPLFFSSYRVAILYPD
jgi:hypothetical protein